MNKHERYVEVCKQMELLGIVDVSTTRQTENGTRVWRLPIKYSTHPKFIEVASFKTGYVRNQNGGYTNYQLNKRIDNKPEYWKNYKWNDDMTKQTFTGTYRKFVTRGCKLIPNEIDRLEYLIAYCLKNYYIKLANQVIDGKYVSKWKHEYELERQEVQKIDFGHYDRIKDLEVEVELLQEQLEHMTKDRDYYKAHKKFGDSMYEGRDDRVKELENKLDAIKRYVDHG